MITTINELRHHSEWLHNWDGKNKKRYWDTSNKKLQNVLEGHVEKINLPTLTQIATYDNDAFVTIMALGLQLKYQKFIVTIQGNARTTKVELLNTKTGRIEKYTVSNRGLLDMKDYAHNKQAGAVILSVHNALNLIPYQHTAESLSLFMVEDA